MKSLENIRKLRKRHNLTQKELAFRAGVSQSLIAKIESGKLDPSYTKAQLIFDSLEQLQYDEGAKAKDVMNKKVIFANKDDPLIKIIKLMKDKSISQLPVLSDNNVLGIITERIILKNIMDNQSKIQFMKVECVMEDAPPTVSLNTSSKTLFNMLQEHPIVLVNEKGMIKGIISKSDLLMI